MERHAFSRDLSMPNQPPIMSRVLRALAFGLTEGDARKQQAIVDVYINQRSVRYVAASNGLSKSDVQRLVERFREVVQRFVRAEGMSEGDLVRKVPIPEAA